MKVGKICLLFFMSASILLAGCGNAKNKKGEDNLVGNDKTIMVVLLPQVIPGVRFGKIVSAFGSKVCAWSLLLIRQIRHL